MAHGRDCRPASGNQALDNGCFSFAYLTLAAEIGALRLFGAVQLTLLGAGLYAGEWFAASALIGSGSALAGMLYPVLPRFAAPAPFGTALKATAGVAWSVYSLRGR